MQPGDQLEIGKLVQEYKQKPLESQVRNNIGGELGSLDMFKGPIEKKHGTILDEDVLTGR